MAEDSQFSLLGFDDTIERYGIPYSRKHRAKIRHPRTSLTKPRDLESSRPLFTNLKQAAQVPYEAPKVTRRVYGKSN